MYFNNTNSFFHGIMFHYFHDDRVHSRDQGSISKDDFYKLINFIDRKNILDADVFFNKFHSTIFYKPRRNPNCTLLNCGVSPVSTP